MKIKSNVKIIQTDLSRNDFTRHEMHLDASGKEKAVELIGRSINVPGKEHDESPNAGVGGHFVEAEVGGGPHLLKLLHSLVNFAFTEKV
jgi:hypothetical protein